MQRSLDVAFDISFLSTSGGFGTYTAQLIKHLAILEADRSYLLLENRLPTTVPQYRHRDSLLSTRAMAWPPAWNVYTSQRRSRVFWALWDLPRTLQRFAPALFHSVDNVSVPSKRFRGKTVLTLHDIIPISHPHFCRRRDAAAAQLLIQRAVKYADAIITESHYSADRIRDRFPDANSRIFVVRNGVDHDVFVPIADRDATARAMAEKHAFYSPLFLLTVATLNPRRNLVRLLHAYHRHLQTAGDVDSCLVIAGCRGWKDSIIFETVRQLRLDTRVHFMDFVPDADLIKLYQSACVVLHPSLLEGFGLPVVEAMACATPVICSSTTSLGEIAGDAALLIDPLDTDELAHAITTLLADTAQWHHFSQKGVQQAQTFQWATAADQTRAIYRQIT
jgi:glycosyltransferase involved in cell wall biosynthesis